MSDALLPIGDGLSPPSRGATASSASSVVLLCGRLSVALLSSAGGAAGARQLLASPLTSFDPHDGHDEVRGGGGLGL